MRPLYGPRGVNRAAKVPAATAAGAEKQLGRFIDKFDPKNRALIRSCRKVLRRRFPTANELVWDNYNFFVIGYSATERPSDTVVSLAAGGSGVGLSFYRGATLPDPHGILLGEGAQNRFIRLESAKTLARPEVEALIAAAVAQTKTPLPASGRGRLIIRSVSKKQRPRRKPATSRRAPSPRPSPPRAGERGIPRPVRGERLVWRKKRIGPAGSLSAARVESPGASVIRRPLRRCVPGTGR